ncbi:MAG: HNH endonuclease [Desulfobacteraceae bacterium]|nr:HNH endonuclease [Desulfobacteraceae bacterium]
MNEFMHIPDEDDIRMEKNKARELRRSQWWKRKCAKGICYYCKNQFSSNELTMDHIVPLSRGGKTEKNNVVPCCKKCNSEKKSHLFMDWRPASSPENNG